MQEDTESGNQTIQDRINEYCPPCNPRIQEAMRVLLPQMKQMIVDEAAKYKFSERELFDFVLSCAVNLLGNLTLQAAGDNIEKMKDIGAISIKNLIAWFEVVITMESQKKEMH